MFGGKWIVDEFMPVAGDRDESKNWDGPYFGADWGFSTDPTVLLKMWVHDKRLYIENEAYKVGCDIVDTPKLFDLIEGSRTHKIRADCSRPETIHHVAIFGFDCEGAEKWQGSVEDGIQYLRGFEKIVIHPRCKHMAEEGRGCTATRWTSSLRCLARLEAWPLLLLGCSQIWLATHDQEGYPPPKYVPFHGGWRPRR